MAEKAKTNNRGNAGKGRRKGSLNKTTLAAKEAIMLAAKGLNGVDGLVAWAKANDDNLRLFWSVIYPKLLPLKVNSEVEVGTRFARALTWLPPK
ncbi:MAG: hypothetical protein ACT4OE_07320 [Sphingosinicella sp.]